MRTHTCMRQKKCAIAFLFSFKDTNYKILDWYSKKCKNITVLALIIYIITVVSAPRLERPFFSCNQRFLCSRTKLEKKSFLYRLKNVILGIERSCYFSGDAEEERSTCAHICVRAQEATRETRDDDDAHTYFLSLSGYIFFVRTPA